MVSVLCIQQSFAGNGTSTPLKEESGDLPKTSKSPTPIRKSDDNGETIIAGLAVLTISGGSNLGSRRISPQRNEGNFLYSNENFSSEAWKKDNNLPNSFSPSGLQGRYEPQNYRERCIIYESEHNSNSALHYSQADNSSDSSETLPQIHKGCPVIDLSEYEGVAFEGATKIDLHPVYNGNFKKYLRDEIYKRQLAYQRSETKENKFYISTGTGKKRPGLNFTLQNAVDDLLKDDYFRSRIAYYRLEKEGFFAIFLRKNKKQNNSK